MSDYSFDISLLSNGFSDHSSSVDTIEALSPESNISSTGSPDPRRSTPSRCRITRLNEAHAIYGCCECEESFLAARLLERHLRDAHPWLRSSCVCPECGQRFLHAGHVARHRRERHVPPAERQPHRCDLCDRRFKRAEHLRAHERARHARARDFACALCARTFARRYHALRHQRSHRSEAELRCDGCGKLFARGLARHRAVCREGRTPEPVEPQVQVQPAPQELVCPVQPQVVAEFEVEPTTMMLSCEEDDWIKLLVLR